MQTLASPQNCCSPCSDTPTTQVPGPAGAAGANGTNGTDGKNAYTILAAFTAPSTGNFVQPGPGEPIVATVGSSGWAVIGEDAVLEGGGYYLVTAIPDATHVTLQNRGYTGAASPGTLVTIGSRLAPSGQKGTTGAAGTGSGDMLSAHNLAVGATGVANASTALSNLGGSVVGKAMFSVANPSAIRFIRVDAANTVTLLSDTDMRTALGLAIGTNVQAYDAELTTWAAIAPSANAITFISAANNAAMRTALGVIADNYALYEHRQANGVNGGDFNNGEWRTVPITTEVSDVNNLGTLAANEVTLIAGTYRFQAWTNAYNVATAQARLWNNTAAAVITYGRCSVSSGASTQLTLVEGRFTIGVASAIRLEAQCSVTEAVDGFGKALSFGGTEVYAGITFIKE